MTITTNPNYWDCECIKNYIHKKTDSKYCGICGTSEDEQPDSRASEIFNKGTK